MQTRVYRGALWGWILGGGLILFGAYAAWDPFNHLRTGTPWWVSNGKYSSGFHVASHNETVFYVFYNSCIWVVGFLVLYVCAKRSITLDKDGVILRQAFKGITFMEPYGELASFSKHVGRRSGKVYTLSSRNGKSIPIGNLYGGLDDLVNQILVRAPQLGYVHGVDDSANS